MTPNRCRQYRFAFPQYSAAVALLLTLSATVSLPGAEAALAGNARFDLLAQPAVGELQAPHLRVGDGSCDRMNWVEAAEQPRSITTQFAISPQGWREFELQFVPAKSGEVTLQLMGPWEKGPDGQLVRLEILWDALTAEGCDLPNGSFEELPGGQIRGWSGDPSLIQASTEQVPAVAGTKIARTWHDQKLVATLRVTGGQQVTLRGHARAKLPAGYVEMKRAANQDTPAHRALRQFRHGVNFGNFLEVPPKQTWSVLHTAEDLKQARAQGFDHVRIPIGWHHYTGPAPEFKLRDEIFRRVDDLVANAQAQQLAVMLNIHHFDEFTTDPHRERARFVAIWRQVAEHYASSPASVAFELLNEPKDAATASVLNAIYPEAIREIRRTNPDRTIFVGPARWNSAEELVHLQLPDDDWNLIVTIHFYGPMYFTHQGATWTGPDFLLTGVQFPGPPAQPLRVPPRGGFKPYVVEWMNQYNRLPTAENPAGPRAYEEYFRRADEWSRYFGRPIHVGEFGAIAKADPQSRANYYRSVRLHLEKLQMGWAIWDWKAGFRYWNEPAKRPESGLHEALFGAQH